MRLVVCAVCAYGIYLAIEWKQAGWAFAFGLLIAIFQPLIKLAITRETWAYVDVITAVFLVATIFLMKERKLKI